MKLTVEEFLKECDERGILVKGASQPIIAFDGWNAPVTNETSEEGDIFDDEEDPDEEDEDELENEDPSSEDDSDADNGNANPLQHRTTTLLVSTDHPDRKGHIISPHGISLENYKLNPVLMWNHEGYQNPNAIIGKTLSVTQNDHSVSARVKYAHLKFNKLPSQLWELEKQKMLPGNSIGVRPTGRITREGNITTIGRSDLMDISKVAVGQNAKATNKLI
jgi:hypothetical protein